MSDIIEYDWKHWIRFMRLYYSDIFFRGTYGSALRPPPFCVTFYLTLSPDRLLSSGPEGGVCPALRSKTRHLLRSASQRFAVPRKIRPCILGAL